MNCENCPCPDVCLGRPIFCEWAARGENSFHICERSRIAREQEYAPFSAQFTNVLMAIGRAGKALATGKKIAVPPEEQERRLAICHGCDQYDPGPDKCKVCGCVAVWKTRLATEHCPLNPPKW